MLGWCVGAVGARQRPCSSTGPPRADRPRPCAGVCVGRGAAHRLAGNLGTPLLQPSARSAALGWGASPWRSWQPCFHCGLGETPSALCAEILRSRRNRSLGTAALKPFRWSSELAVVLEPQRVVKHRMQHSCYCKLHVAICLLVGLFFCMWCQRYHGGRCPCEALADGSLSSHRAGGVERGGEGVGASPPPLDDGFQLALCCRGEGWDRAVGGADEDVEREAPQHIAGSIGGSGASVGGCRSVRALHRSRRGFLAQCPGATLTSGGGISVEAREHADRKRSGDPSRIEV